MLRTLDAPILPITRPRPEALTRLESSVRHERASIGFCGMLG